MVHILAEHCRRPLRAIAALSSSATVAAPTALSGATASTSASGASAASAAAAAAVSSSSGRPVIAALRPLPPLPPPAVAAAAAPVGIEHLPFFTLCTLFDKLEQSKWVKRVPGGGRPASASGPGRMERCSRLLSRFFDHCAQLGGDPFPLFALLVPDADLERVFDCKETTLVALLTTAFGIKNTRTAEMLKQWRTGVAAATGAPAKGTASASERPHSMGDLSLVVHSVLASYVSSKPSLTLGQVNARLDALARRSVWSTLDYNAGQQGLVAKRATIVEHDPLADGLQKFAAGVSSAAPSAASDDDNDSPSRQIFLLYSRCTSLEHKWLTRIILRNLNVGLKARAFMDAFHRNFFDLYRVRGSLREACKAVRKIMQAETRGVAIGPALSTAGAESSNGKGRKRTLSTALLDDGLGATADDDGGDLGALDSSAAAAALASTLSGAGAEDPSSPSSSLLSRLLVPEIGAFVSVMLCGRAHSLPWVEATFAQMALALSKAKAKAKDKSKIAAGRGKAAQTEAAAKDEPTFVDVSVSEKFDGERIQVHVWRRRQQENMDYATALAALASEGEGSGNGSGGGGGGFTYHSPHSPFSVRLFSRSARNSTLERVGVCSHILASLGLQPCEDGTIVPPLGVEARAVAVPVAAPTTSGVKMEDEPLPALESAFVPAAAATSPSPSPSPSPSRSRFMPTPRALAFEDVILDGEILVYNELRGELEPFGGLRDLVPWGVPRVATSGRHNVHRLTDQHRHHCLILFDVLRAQGRSVMHLPHRERQDILRRVVERPRENYVQIARETVVRIAAATAATVANGATASATAAAAAAALSPIAAPSLHSLYLDCLSRHGEGLVLKLCSSRYLPGERAGWFKLKKDYIAGLGDSIDLAIVGAQYGMGGQGGRLNCFTLAAWQNVPASSAAPPSASALAQRQASPPLPFFHGLFEVGIGLSRDEGLALDALLAPLVEPFSPRSPPAWLYLPKGMQMHVVLRDPRRALVAEVLGSGFLQGCLRFPRLQRLKLGCAYTAALRMDAYMRMAFQAQGRMSSGETQALEQRMRALERQQREQLVLNGRAGGKERLGRFDFSAPGELGAPAAAAAAATPERKPSLAAACSVALLLEDFVPSKRPKLEEPSRAALVAIDLRSPVTSPARPVVRSSPRRRTGAASGVKAEPGLRDAPAAAPWLAASGVASSSARVPSVIDLALQLYEQTQQEQLQYHQQDAWENDDSATICHEGEVEEDDNGSAVSEQKVKLEPPCAGVKQEVASLDPAVKMEIDAFGERERAGMPDPVAVSTSDSSGGAAVKLESQEQPDAPMLSESEPACAIAPPAALQTPPRARGRHSKKKHKPPKPLRSPPPVEPLVASPGPVPSAAAPRDEPVPPDARATSPSRLLNPKKLFECPRSNLLSRFSTSSSPVAEPSDCTVSWRPCVCRREVWLTPAAVALAHGPVETLLCDMGFVLLERPQWGCATRPPGIIVVQDEDGDEGAAEAERFLHAAEFSATGAESAAMAGDPHGSCPPRPTWIVSVQFLELLRAPCVVAAPAPLAPPGASESDVRALRKRFYSALARSLLRTVQLDQATSKTARSPAKTALAPAPLPFALDPAEPDLVLELAE